MDGIYKNTSGENIDYYKYIETITANQRIYVRCLKIKSLQLKWPYTVQNRAFLNQDILSQSKAVAKTAWTTGIFCSSNFILD